MKGSITNDQKKKFYVMLRNSGLTDHKEDLVSAFTSERTTHVSEMTQAEYRALIDNLKKDDPCERMKSKIYAIFFSIGWIREGDETEWKINHAVMDGWLLKKGKVKKKFNQLTCNDYRLVLAQLEALQKNHNMAQLKKEAAEEVASILSQLGISRGSK